MHHRRYWFRLLQLVQLGWVVFLTALVPVAHAQTPNAARTIRLIVPYAPGGPIDVTARLLAEQVKDTLGTVIIENKPGAGGNIGSEMVARAAPDGLTIGIAAVATHAVNPWLYKRMPFDAQNDFAPITQILQVPNVLVMNAAKADALNIKTLDDFVRYARAHPGKLNYGSGGNGSAGHLAGEMFKSQAGFYAVHIPYNGANPSQLALLSGQVDFTFDNLATASANIRSGKLRALALTGAQRSDLLAGVPAIAETYPEFVISTWWGLVAPAKTPVDVLEKLNQAFVTALKTESTKTRFAALMAEPVPSTREQFSAMMKSELRKYEQIVKRSGAQVD